MTPHPIPARGETTPRCPHTTPVPGWVCTKPAGHYGEHAISVERYPDVYAPAARCEKCRVMVINPTTGLIAGACAYCGGRMTNVESAQTCGCGRPMFQYDPTNRPDLWACVMWGCSFKHVPPAASLPVEPAGTPRRISDEDLAELQDALAELRRADTSGDETHIAAAFERFYSLTDSDTLCDVLDRLAALTSEVSRLTALNERYLRQRDEINTERVALHAEVSALREAVDQHYTVIDDAIDKVICQQRADRRRLVHEASFLTAPQSSTSIGAIDAYLVVLEAARAALRAARRDGAP